MSHLVPVKFAPGSSRTPSSSTGLLDHPLARAIYIALVSSRLCRKPGFYKSVRSFIDRWVRSYERSPDSCLKSLKVHVSRVRVSLLKGVIPSRELMGQILPRCLSQTRKHAALLQYTRLGRALPPLSRLEVDRAVLAQRARLQTSFDRPVPESVLNQLKLVPAVGFGPMVCTDLVSASSCLEKTRKEGGRSSLLKGQDVDPPRKPMSAMTRLARCDVIRDSEMTDVGHFDALPLGIPEQGAKVRIVTKHSAVAVANSHRGRRALWPLLTDKLNVSTAESIADSTLEVLRFPKAKYNSFVFSADLTAATDNLGWPYIRELCSRLEIPFSWVSPSTLSGEPVCRGTGMGLPSSWPVLSIAHYCICRAVDPNHSFRIKGDDLIALWDVEQISHYHRLCEAVGFLINGKKTVSSVFWGTFCEVTYRRAGRTLYRQRDFSVRALCRGEPMPMEHWRYVASLGIPQKLLYGLHRLACRRWYRLAHKSKVEVYLPPQIGGLGFPPKRTTLMVSPKGSSLHRALHNGITIPLQMEEVGTSMLMYLRAFDRVKWSVNGSEEETARVKAKMYLLGRAAFIDCALGKWRKLSTSIGARVRRLAEFSRKFQKVSPEPFPTDYETVYRTISRLQVVDSDPLLWVGRSSEICTRDESLVSGVVRL